MKIDIELKETIKNSIMDYLKTHGDTPPAKLAAEIPYVEDIYPFEEIPHSNRVLWYFSIEAIEATNDLVQDGEIKIDTKSDIVLMPSHMLPMKLAGKQKKYVKARFVKSIFRRI